jgi:hypothetical protein
MLEAIKGYLGDILIGAAFFVFGTVAGLTITPNENGIYLAAHWGGQEVFVLGKSDLSVRNLNLDKLADADAKILVTKLEKLSTDALLSKDLVALKDRRKGPFTPVDLKIDVRFIDTEQFSGPLAMACPGSAVYGRKILLHEIVLPQPNIAGDANRIANRIMEFNVVLEQNFSECDQGESSKNIIWVNRKMLHIWLDVNDIDLPFVSVKARIMSTLFV